VTETQAVPQVEKRPIVLGIWLIIAGALGLLAAFELTIDKIAVLENPNAILPCNVSFLVQCGKNLSSPQGSLFGFPNPLIGLVAWPIVILIGVALLSGVRFPRWMWIGFNIGIVGALALVIFLIKTSLYDLNTLCPWCMLTWLVTIPTFWLVTLRNVKTYGRGRLGSFAAAAYSWVPIISLACFLLIAILAQVKLDVIDSLF
jgi:uncharacterized membrane protein